MRGNSTLSSTMRPCDRWHDLGEGVQAWKCVAPCLSTVASVVEAFKREREGSALRLRWGAVESNGAAFTPHVDVHTFENAVSRMHAFEGWSCRHAERAVYEILHDTARGPVVTRSYARPSESSAMSPSTRWHPRSFASEGIHPHSAWMP